MKRILVPTDFSKAAKVAIDFAVETAKLFPAKIYLIHSFVVEDNYFTDYVNVDREFNMSMLSGVREKLNAIKRSIQEDSDVEVEVEVSVEGLLVAIETAVKKNKIDLIVMGTHGASGLLEKIWGSNTTAVIGKTTVPVMVVPMNYKWYKPENILLATKEFEKDSDILAYIFEMAYLYLSNVHTVVFTDEKADEVSKYVQNSKNLEEYKTYLQEEYSEENLSATHLIGGDFQTAIKEYIEDNRIDILVMITHQNGFWKRLFNPSVTKKMSLHSEVPLLAIPAK